MSIIHDALKKVQQRLAPKPDAAAPEAPLDNLYVTPPIVETLAPTIQPDVSPKQALNVKIKNIITLCLAMAVTAGSVYYLYYQFKDNIPQVNAFAKKEFYKIVYKKEPPPAFKTKAPEELKPLAQLTVTSSKASPVTLNIHGIMSNGTGNLVLINDQVYQEGDEVDGAKIVKINLDSITVSINGAQQTIYVKN